MVSLCWPWELQSPMEVMYSLTGHSMGLGYACERAQEEGRPL